MAKIIGNPTVTPMAIPDWNQTDEKKADFIKNKPTILTKDDVVDLIIENGDSGGGIDIELLKKKEDVSNKITDDERNKTTDLDSLYTDDRYLSALAAWGLHTDIEHKILNDAELSDRKILGSTEITKDAEYYSAKATQEYVKDYVDNKISTVFKYCGTVEFARELPQYNVNENIGYVYNILKSNDDLDESMILIYPGVNVEWYGKVSLISDSYYLTIKDKNGNDITQSLPEGQGMTLIHNAPYPTWDGFPYTSINFDLTDNTTNGWRVSIDDTLLDIIEDKDNIYFHQYMYDILEPKAGDNVVWNGYMWDILSGTIDLSNYATKEDLNNIEGTQGADGKSAYEIAQDHGFEGTEEEWLESLKGEPGKNGVSTSGDGVTDLYTVGKNIFNPALVICNGNGYINSSGEVIEEGQGWVYGDYNLTVDETYTMSKTGKDVYLYFYNEDGTYAGVSIAKGGGNNVVTFKAPAPKVRLCVYVDATKDVSIQLERGDKATTIEPFSIVLNENVKIPIVGEGNLETDGKTLIKAVNELNNNVKNVQRQADILCSKSKNMLDLSKIIRSGNGYIDANTGEVVDGSYYVYGKYDLTVGETYTLSKPSAPVWLYFYNNDESYAGYGTNKGISVTETSKTFEAEYPKVLVMSQKEITSIMVQLELGDAATEYSDYGVTLKDSVRIPIVGKGQLETEADNLVDAVNELNEKAKNVPEIEGDVTELKKQQGKIGQLCTVGKNMLDLSKIIRSGNGYIDANTGEVVDGSYYVYGKYDLTVGETYTISKTTGNVVWLYFYNADGSYRVVESVFSIGAIETEKTFEATYPLVAVVSMREPTAYNVQIELGETKTEYEPHCVKLNEEVAIPIVGDDELHTEAKTLIGAVNELKESTDDIPVIKTDINESKDGIFEIKKALPRLNEEITGWTFEFFGADGKLIANNTTWYSSNKILLLAGKTYNILGAYLDYTVYYDLDGNFLGRGTECESVTTALKYTGNNYEGTVTVGASDVYAVLQTFPSKFETAYISRYVDEKASTDICEKLLINKNLMDKKILIFGDSISTGDTSAKIYANEKYGGYNKWVEALIDDNYIAEHNVRNDSIHATGFVSRVNGEDDLITRLRNTKDKDTDFDLVIVFAGINDAIRANLLEIGFGMDEQGNKQTDILKYFVPAVDKFFAELVEKFVNSRICVVLPLRTFHTYAGPGTVEMWDGTTHLETDYSDYIAKVAKEYCLPVLDATNQSGFTPFNSAFKNRWTLQVGGVHDGVHPTEEYCQKYLSKYIRGFIDGLI